MDLNDVFSASLKLSSLKKREILYRNALQHLNQEYVKLQIEELALRAAIRQETMNAEKEIKEQESPYIEKISNSTDTRLVTPVNVQRKQSVNKVHSNITDDRYLEPLILDPKAFDENTLIEFDD